MTRAIFDEWIRKSFLPNLESLRARLRAHDVTNLRALLLTDAHGSRRNPETLQLLADSSVDFVSFPAHTSHVTQPLDCSVFRVFKETLSKNMEEQMESGAITLSKWKPFVMCVRDAWMNATRCICVLKGFMKSGAWPICRENVLRYCGHRVAQPVASAPPKKKRFVKIDNCLLTGAEVISGLREENRNRRHKVRRALQFEIDDAPRLSSGSSSRSEGPSADVAFDGDELISTAGVPWFENPIDFENLPSSPFPECEFEEEICSSAESDDAGVANEGNITVRRAKRASHFYVDKDEDEL